MEHKHASVLRAIADGVPPEEFEIRCNDPKTDWDELQEGYSAWFYYPAQWEIRRKPQYIMVNGFKVPKPLDVMPEGRAVFVPSPWERCRYTSLRGSAADYAIELRIAHGSVSEAVAHCDAMLGIDPKWEE